MVAGGLPTVQVYLDDGSGTFPYELTNMGGKSYARIGYQVSRGRQDELSQVTAGQLQNLLLDNTDGRFTPGSTIIATPSPIKADAQIRVKVTANGTTVNRFTGYVQSWPVGWPTGGDTLSEVTLTATDAQARGERRILQAVNAEQVLADSAAALYKLDDTGPNTAADSSGNQAPPLQVYYAGFTTTPPTFGDTITVPSGLSYPAVRFHGNDVAFQLAPELMAANAQPFTWVCVLIQGTPPAPLFGHILNCSAADGSRVGIGINTDASGLLRAVVTTTGGVDLVAAEAASSLNSGVARVVHAVATQGAGASVSLYADGVLRATSPTGTVVFASAGDFEVGGIDTSFKLALVAGGSGTLTAAQVAAQADAILTGSAEAGTARISRIAGYADLPVGTLDTSLTTVTRADLAGKTASAALLEVADAEVGIVFYDGSGNLTFHNRNRTATKTAPDVTVDANFLDEGTAFTTDMQGVINYFETTAAGTSVTQVVADATSQTSHGRYSQSQTYLVQTDAEALDRANWIVATHKEPGPRVGTLALDLLTMTAAQQAQMLAIEPDTWIRVIGLPAQTPGGTTADLIVQGWSDTLGPDGWTLTLNVVDKNTVYPSVWLLGAPTFGVLDSTTRLYV